MSQHDWNESYTSGGPLPWDTGEPDGHLVELVKAKRVRVGRALEVGCGTGTNAVWLAQQGFEVLGVDIAPAAVELARARAAKAKAFCRFATVDFLGERLDEPPFDLVYDRGCFHVFDAAAEQRLFAEHVAGLLAPGGIWVSVIGSTEGSPREMGPPRRSARDIVNALEPVLAIHELSATQFEAVEGQVPLAWLCISARREIPAQPSTVR